MQALKMLCDKIKGKANFSDSEEEEMHALLMFGIAPGPSLGLTPVTKNLGISTIQLAFSLVSSGTLNPVCRENILSHQDRPLKHRTIRLNQAGETGGNTSQITLPVMQVMVTSPVFMGHL